MYGEGRKTPLTRGEHTRGEKNGGTTPKRTMKVPEINDGTQGKLWKDTV